MIVLSAFAPRVLAKRPLPSFVIARDWNGPGATVPASRQWRVAAISPTALSSASWQETVTTSLLFGTAGECFTRWMTGAMFGVSAEFGSPGVPPVLAERFQFWPLLTASLGFRRSTEHPASLAALIHDQPPSGLRVLTAQSPSSA